METLCSSFKCLCIRSCILWAGKTVFCSMYIYIASLVAQMVINLPAMQEIQGLILGSGRYPGEGNGNPLQYSCLKNSMDRGAWQAQSMGLQSRDVTEWLTHRWCFVVLTTCHTRHRSPSALRRWTHWHSKHLHDLGTIIIIPILQIWKQRSWVSCLKSQS